MIVTDSFLLLSASLASSGILWREPREVRVDEPSGGVPIAPARWGAVARPTDSDHWRDGDIARAATLLHAAYPRDIGRHFAPHGTAAEWLRYVTALVTESPCGTFNPQLTRVIRDDDDLRALALVTLVAPATAHLAQLAVRPDSRRQGVARALVRDAAATASAAGCDRLTLLVAAANAPARRLYESLGFSSIPHV